MTNKDDTPLLFGKYKGKTPNEIATYDPQYLVWAYDNTDRVVCTKELRDACEDTMIEYYEEKEYDMYFGLDGW